jgi:hypothetical protein
MTISTDQMILFYYSRKCIYLSGRLCECPINLIVKKERKKDMDEQIIIIIITSP